MGLDMERIGIIRSLNWGGVRSLPLRTRAAASGALCGTHRRGTISDFIGCFSCDVLGLAYVTYLHEISLKLSLKKFLKIFLDITMIR